MKLSDISTKQKQHLEKLAKMRLGSKHTQETKDKIGLSNFKGGLPKCKCGKSLSRKEYTRCRSCFALERKGKFIKEEVTYHAIHRWIRVVYGSANECEGFRCEHKSKTFEWSLLKGKNYERKRENYWQLCKTCHNLYDCVYDRKKIKQT